MCDCVVFGAVVARAAMRTRGIWKCIATARVVQPYPDTHYLET